MKKIFKIITSLLLMSFLLLGSVVPSVSAAETGPMRDPSPVSGTYTNKDISGYGFSGSQQTWNEYNSTTYTRAIGDTTSITFSNSISGQAAADYYKAHQNSSFSQQVTTAGVIFTFLPYGSTGVKIANVAVAAGSLTCSYFVDASFPLAAGDNLYVNSNTVKISTGTPTTTTVIRITASNGTSKYYSRSVR